MLFALVAGAAALFALDQRNDAQQSQAETEAPLEAEAAARAEADENAAKAEANEADADRQREAALAAQADAEQQAEIARARELTLIAEKALESDPELSAHLALTALAALQEAGADSAQAVSAVRAAVASDRVTFRVPGGDAIAVHPDGALLAAGDEDGGMTVWDIASRQIVERYHREDVRPGSAAFSPDGNLLAVGFINEDATAPNVTIWDRTSGESVDIGPVVVVEAYDLVFSHDGQFLAFTGFDPASETPDSMVVWAVEEQEILIDTHGWGPDFSGEDALAYVTMTEAGEPIVVTIDPVSGDAIHQVRPGFLPFWATWSPDGTRIAAAEVTTVVVFDLESGEEIARPEVDRVRRPVWLTNDTFMIGGESIPKVVDAWTGEVLMALPGQAGGTGEYAVVPGTAAVASAGMLDSGSGAVIFDTSPIGGYEVAGWSSPLDTNFKAGYVGDGSRVIIEDGDSHVTANARDGGEARITGGTGVAFAGGAPTGALWIADTDPAGNFVYHGTPDGSWVLRSLATDEVPYRAPPGWSIRGTNSDGTQVVIKEGVGFCGPFRLVSTQDDSANDLALQCAALFAFSPDGEMVAALSAGEFGVAFFDTASGELLADLTGTGYTAFGGAFTPDGSKLVVGSHDGLLYLLDIEVLLSGGAIEDAIVLEREAHDTFVTRVVVSPDGRMATSSATAEPLRLWDLDSGELVDEFGEGGFTGEHLGDFHPTLNHLMVTIPPNLVRIHTLDVDELVAIAESRLSRDMTEPECDQYFRSPCP